MLKRTVLFLLPLCVFGQRRINNIDSLKARLNQTARDTNRVIVLNKLAFELSDRHPEKGLDYALESIKLAQELNWQKGLAEAYTNAGVNYEMQAAHEKALKNELQALQIYRQLGSKRGIAAMQANISLIYQNQADYKRALNYALQALKTDEDLGLKSDKAIILENIGTIFFREKNYSKTIYYYKQATSLNEELGDTTAMARNKGNMGMVLNELGNYEKAVQYGQEALAINQRYGFKRLMQINLSNIGNAELNLGNFDKALKYKEQALQISRDLNSRSSIATSLGNLGELYLKMAQSSGVNNKLTVAGQQNNLQKAIYYLEKGVEECAAIHFYDPLMEFNQQLSEAYTLAGRYKDALQSYRRYATLKDSIHSVQLQQQLDNMESNYQIDLRDRNLRLKDDKLRIQQMEIIQNRNRITLYILSIILLVGIIAVIVWSLRNSKKSNRELLRKNQEQIELIGDQMDQLKKHSKVLNEIVYMQAHDVRGPVATLLGMAHMFNKKNPADPINELIIKNMEKVTMKLDIAVKEVITKKSGMEKED